MKKIFTLRFWASIVMILTAAVMMNAQTDFSWCVIAHDNGKEVGWHSVNVITDIQLTSQSATFVLTDGKTFPYPITSTTFTFEQRAGNGTAIEVINAPKWNVYYNGSSLHFTESVNSVAVYSVSGILIAKVSGNYTDVPVNLAKGIYIVQASGKTVKLLVTNNGSGAAYAQPTVAESAPQVSYAPASSNPVTLRSANAAVTKQYWNVHYNNTVIAVEIAQVSSFYFTTDNAVVFALVNGSTVQLPNYQTIDFGTQPAQPAVTNWDMVKTLKFGGASYAWGFDPPTITWAAVHKNGLAFHAVQIDNSYSEDQRFANSAINSALWDAGNNPNSRLSMFYDSRGNSYGMGYPDILQDIPIVRLRDTNGIGHSTRASEWSFNNNSNLIPTTFVQGANGSITMSCTNYNGKAWSYTFNTW